VLTLTRTQLALVVVPLVALLTVAGSRLAGGGASEGPSRATPLTQLAGDDAAGEAAAAPRLVVHVVGAVRRAGLFRLPEGARVADALERAGGPTARADVSAVYLAAPLVDGPQVVVPRRGPPGSSSAGAPAAGTKVSLALQPSSSSTSCPDRPGDRREDRGPAATGRSGRWTTSTRCRASVRPGSSSCATW
jgi:competence protein ComEA